MLSRIEGVLGPYPGGEGGSRHGELRLVEHVEHRPGRLGSVLIAIGLIVLDLALFMVPIVPFFVAYVLVVRPPWFKEFVDRLYDGR